MKQTRISLIGKLVPGVGIEPTTLSSSSSRSTTELPRLFNNSLIKKGINICIVPDFTVFVNNSIANQSMLCYAR